MRILSHIRDHAPEGFSRIAWRGFADLGLLALQVPEPDGGLGGTAIDTLLVTARRADTEELAVFAVFAVPRDAAQLR